MQPMSGSATFLMNFLNVMGGIIGFFQDLIEDSHPYFLEFQAYLTKIIQYLRHVNKKFNPLLLFEKKPPIVNNECKADPFLRYASIITCLISFIGVLMWCMWRYRKKQNELITSLDLQIEDYERFKKKKYEKLKEIHKILLELKLQLVSEPENAVSHPFLDSSQGISRRSKLPSKSLYSNVSKRQNNILTTNENAVKLNESFQKILELLEEQTEGKSNPKDPDECLTETFNDEDVLPALESKMDIESQDYLESSWMKSSEINQFLSLENKIDDGRIVTNKLKGVEEACAACLRTKEMLSYLQQQLHCKPYVEHISADSRSTVQNNRKFPYKNMMENRSSEMNMSSCVQNVGCGSSEVNSNMRKSSDTSKVSKREKDLNIEILFNRAFRVGKTSVQ